MMTTLRAIIAADPRVVEILSTVGTPYWWGKGTPATPWPSDAYRDGGSGSGGGGGGAPAELAALTPDIDIKLV
jgi:hypothetical protein